VTAVGGTTQVPEVAAEFSGGGFSNIVRFAVFHSCCNNNLDKETFKVPTPKVARGRHREVSQIAA